jgi:hypothetical protein
MDFFDNLPDYLFIAAAAVGLFFAARELYLWYFKINLLHKKLDAIIELLGGKPVESKADEAATSETSESEASIK